MKRIYHRYELWECHKHKMYDDELNDVAIKCSFDVLTKPEVLEQGMHFVSTQWKYSSENFLTNKSRNRQAYLGQAACCWLVHSSELATKTAWNMLTDKQRDEANAVADRTLVEFDKRYS